MKKSFQKKSQTTLRILRHRKRETLLRMIALGGPLDSERLPSALVLCLWNAMFAARRLTSSCFSSWNLSRNYHRLCKPLKHGSLINRNSSFFNGLDVFQVGIERCTPGVLVRPNTFITSAEHCCDDLSWKER